MVNVNVNVNALILKTFLHSVYTLCHVVRVKYCEVGVGYGFRASTPFVSALNNQRYLLMRSSAAVGIK